MNFLKLLIVIGIAGGAYHYWQQHHSAGTAAAESAAPSRNGFVALPPADGHNAKVVYVVAAENCPHEEAQRADRLASDLSREGIPVTRTHDINFTLAAADSAQVDHIKSVMNGPLPIVFVRGRAKSNPTLDEVVAEYDGDRR